MPICFARVRVDQCVDPSAGFSVNVTRTTSLDHAFGQPRLAASALGDHPDPGHPALSEPRRQARTVFALTPQRRPISSFATPSAASSRPLACRTARCGNDGDAAIASRSARCAVVTASRAAARVADMQQY